jgi:hypothetical protein
MVNGRLNKNNRDYMKIAIYCPLAPLDRYGYQYNYMATIGSFCSLADRVYAVSTSRNSSNIDKVLSISNKIVNVSDERTWFRLDENGDEVFDVYKAGDEITSPSRPKLKEWIA